MANASSLLSVVAIVRNDAQTLDPFVAKTIQVLSENKLEYELILVDDGSIDETPLIIGQILKRYECVRVLRLSRVHGNDIAITAGLDSSIGDYAIVMIAASDPPERVPSFLAKARENFDIVIGTNPSRKRSLLGRLARKAYFQLFHRLTAFELPEHAATMRLFNRETLNALTRIRQKTVHSRLLGCAIGFRTTTVPYTPASTSASAQRRSWRNILEEAVSLLVVNSPAPLRLVSGVGALAALANVLYMFYVVSVPLWKDQVAEGWTTLSLQMSLMFLLLFSTLVILSEYLVHTFEEVKDRPLYHVIDEKNSSTALSDAKKRNVYSQPTDDYEPKQPPHRAA